MVGSFNIRVSVPITAKKYAYQTPHTFLFFLQNSDRVSSINHKYLALIK
jgi:hypothetical protein